MFAQRIALISLLALALLFGAWLGSRPQPEAGAPPEALVPVTQRPDFRSFSDVSEKKTAFFNYLLPYVKAGNEKIVAERARLHTLQAKLASGEALKAGEKAWIADMRKRYRVKADDPDLSALGKRIDVIPESLVLAQAANESAWGTSRFARNGHNYFGIWCFSADCGFVPRDRDSDATHQVTEFRSVQAAVDYYLLTLNSHPAYRSLRDIRSELRDAGERLSGTRLAGGLLKYSERGEAYVEEIRAMIRFNRLQRYTVARG